MIIRWYLIREVLKTFLAVFIVVFLILLSTQVLRVLSAVSDGKITLDLLFVLLGLTNIKSLALIFPLTLFLSIILALSRFYKDSEIIAMWSCGISPKTILSSLLPIIFIFVFIELIFALHVSPWANGKITLLKKHVESNADVDVLDRGRFNQFANGNRVIYIEDVSSEGVLKRVFLRLRNGDNNSVVYADTAYIKKDQLTGARYLVFNQGYRYDGQPGSGDYRVIKFKEYGVIVENKIIAAISYDKDEQSFELLLEQQNNQAVAEVQWRISLIISTFVLALLAIPLSKSSPRKGRYAKVLPAILVYFLYSNLLGIAQNFVKKGNIPPEIGMWWVHILFVLLFIYLFGQQMGWRLFKKQYKELKN
ncbi:MAG: LPS export ABC transporter permease LptF [Pseudomonadota bacterium]